MTWASLLIVQVRIPLAWPEVTELARQSLGYRSALRGALARPPHRTLATPVRPWFYFLLNVGLSPGVSSVVNKCSASAALEVGTDGAMCSFPSVLFGLGQLSSLLVSAHSKPGHQGVRSCLKCAIS